MHSLLRANATGSMSMINFYRENMAFMSVENPYYEAVMATRESTPSLPNSPGFDILDSSAGTGCDFVMDGTKLKDHFHLLFHQSPPQPK